MSLRQTLWSSWTVAGYWLHLYRSGASVDLGRRYLVLEHDPSGKTWPIWPLAQQRKD